MLVSHSAFPPLPRVISVLTPSVPSMLLIPSIRGMLERAIFYTVGELVGSCTESSIRLNAFWRVERGAEAQKDEGKERGGRKRGGRKRESSLGGEDDRGR